jgi:hypothetical protein
MRLPLAVIGSQGQVHPTDQIFVDFFCYTFAIFFVMVGCLQPGYLALLRRSVRAVQYMGFFG